MAKTKKKVDCSAGLLPSVRYLRVLPLKRNAFQDNYKTLGKAFSFPVAVCEPSFEKLEH